MTHLDEKSAFKTAYRDYDWSGERYMWAGILNEIRIMRADNVAIHNGEKMDAILLKSPSQLDLEEQKEIEAAGFRGGIMAQLHGGVSDG